MNPRIRKLIGGMIMLGFVVIYALVAMALANSRPMHEASDLVRTLVYIVLGLAWVLPMMPLIVWMERRRP